MDTPVLQASDVSATDQARDTLLQVADLHFWSLTANPLRLLNKRALGILNVALRRRHEFDAERAYAHIEALVNCSCGQLLLTGDFASTSLDEEFEQARCFVETLVKRGFKPYILPGNHDVYTFESVRAHRFERHFGEYLPRNGYPSMHVLPGGTSLLLAPTVCPNLISSRGRVEDHVVRRLKEMLADASDPAIVAGHYPLLLHTPGYTLSKERLLRNAQALRVVLGECQKRVLYVCGHVHRFSYVRDEIYSNLSHLSTGTFFGKHHHGPANGSFSEIVVYPDSFGVYKHTHVDEWTRKSVSAG